MQKKACLIWLKKLKRVSKKMSKEYETIKIDFFK